MSRKPREQPQESAPAHAPGLQNPVDSEVFPNLATEPDQAAIPPQPTARPPHVKPHLRCPICWHNYGGRAGRRKWHRAVSTTMQLRCYSCDQCGHEWTVERKRAMNDAGIEITRTSVVEIRKPA